VMDRRTAIKWMMAAAASAPLLRVKGLAQGEAAAPLQGYGMDPDTGRNYRPGELWPLTLSHHQKATVAILCDTILPADEGSPAASAVGVPDFIDEWISSPYADPAYPGAGDWPFAADRVLILRGLEWIDEYSNARFARAFRTLGEGQRRMICDDICFLPATARNLRQAAAFFARFRDLTLGGFYTTPEGRKDLGYMGNVPLDKFDGPSPEVLRKAGLSG
jgi:Gluconate 2-dehydrogenase subunit 3